MLAQVNNYPNNTYGGKTKNLKTTSEMQKKPQKMFYQKNFSKKFRKIYRKTQARDLQCY